MAEKKKYPFNYRSFAWRIDGNNVPGCSRTPQSCFTPTDAAAKNPGIYFNGYFNHESMDKPFSQSFSFDDFRYFLNVLKAVAYAPGDGKIVKQLACKFFKDGEFKHGGVVLGIVRDEKGLIYFAFKNKRIPTIPFPMLPKGSLEHQNKDGELEDVREVSKTQCISWVERNMAMLDWAIDNCIEVDAPSAGGSSSAPSYGGGSSSYNSTSSNDAPASTAVDFDSDIPF
ncbi:hypothetical protein TSMG0142 [Halocynthia phage JM-2012]|uniref:hypothetical protein n=1 Tax=Halocynthia phage JM-2012 TaxID=1173297 RepID=UPI00025C696A|nr:hypothetical protein TSMG0142 [Halocynthia phage JM-2012]AFI55425.1 hypothetical protein TSMG0142 [Halocynthia phage JM-2012]